jgi:hypothetical protein
MKLRQGLMLLGFVASAGLALFGDKTPDGQVVSPSERAASESAPSAAAVRAEEPGESHQVDKSKAPEILALRERAPYKPSPVASGVGAGVFVHQSWDPPPPKPVSAPPAPPTAPPLPYTYIGKKFEAGVWEVYLSQGDELRVVRPNTLLDSTYRVGAISPPTMNLTYIPLNQVQQLSIGASD